MNRNPLQTIFSKKFWLVCIAVGISLLGIVFALSRQADMQNCEQRLTGVMEFIKAQSADYTKYNDTAVCHDCCARIDITYHYDSCFTLKCLARAKRSAIKLSPTIHIRLLYRCLIFFDLLFDVCFTVRIMIYNAQYLDTCIRCHLINDSHFLIMRQLSSLERDRQFCPFKKLL